MACAKRQLVKFHTKMSFIGTHFNSTFREIGHCGAGAGSNGRGVTQSEATCAAWVGGVAVAQASSLTSSPGTFNVAASALCIMVKVQDASPSTTGRHGLKQTLHRLREKGENMEHERKPRLFRLQSGRWPSSVKPIPDLFQN